MTRLDKGYMSVYLNHQRWFDFGASKNAPKLKTKKKREKSQPNSLHLLEYRLLD